MKKSYPLKACPWCNVTPQFKMGTPLDETWLPVIECTNYKCNVQPKSKYIPIRKKQRETPMVMMLKVEKIVSWWNQGNLPYNGEGFQLDFQQIADDFKAGVIGLPGHRQ